MTVRGFMNPAGFVLMLILAAAEPAAAEPGVEWQAMTGPWRGEGLLRQNPKAELQRGVCRVEVGLGESADSLVFAGRCANATKSARFKTILTQLDKSGRVQAISQSRIYPGEVLLIGERTDRRLQMRSTEPIIIKGRTYHVHLHIDYRLGEDRFSMVQALKDIETGVSANVLEMAFRKK